MMRKVTKIATTLALFSLIFSSSAISASAAEEFPEASPEQIADLQAMEALAGAPAEYKVDPAELPFVPPKDQNYTTGPQLDPYVCTLYPSVVHLRTSSGKNSVGAKPYTECTKGTPSKITHESTLYMIEWVGLSYKVMAGPKSQNGSNTKKLTLTSLEYFCKNSNKSKYVQHTSGTSVQGGKTYYSSVSTAKVDLFCGK